jgi:transcriptional regulator with XRE-family HTH domain
MAIAAGDAVRQHRLRRHLTQRWLAERAGVSAALVRRIESGGAASLEAYARVITALDLRPELLAVDGRERSPKRDGEDLVHAAMGELEAARLRGFGLGVGIDEPFQHYQFAGRADVIGWDLGSRSLLHIENRTRFPNVQEAIASYGTKRHYLARVLADRLLPDRAGWRTVSHVMVALWSAEVLHVLRLRTETFRATCPDSTEPFQGWWDGRPPEGGGVTSSLLVMDPAPGARERFRFADLEAALRLRSRYRGYADAAERLRR